MVTRPAVQIADDAVVFTVNGGALVYAADRWHVVLRGEDPQEVASVEAVEMLRAAFILAGAAAA